MFNLKQINNIKIKPLLVGGSLPVEKIKGGELFSEGNGYNNIYLLAKKKSGKTTVVSKILKECCSKRTNVVIFCSTVNKDDSYKHIIKMLEKKGCNVLKYTSLNEDGENKLDVIIQEIQKEAEKEEQEEPKPKMKYIRVDGDSDDEIERKPRKEKKLSPEWCFLFDDLGEELKSPSVESFLKKNRHYKAKVIISSQWLNQLRPGSIANLDYMLIWKNIPEDKLKECYNKIDLSIDFNEFLWLYNDATYEKYNFLYIDIRNEKFRKNFNKEYFISQ